MGEDSSRHSRSRRRSRSRSPRREDYERRHDDRRRRRRRDRSSSSNSGRSRSRSPSRDRDRSRGRRRSSRRDSESRGCERDRDRERGDSRGRRRRRDRDRDGSAEMSATRTVCIKGVPPEVDETMVAALVSQYAPVINVRLIRERGTKISRGFGFIDFETVELAQQLMDSHTRQQLVIDGSRVALEYSHADSRSLQDLDPRPAFSNSSSLARNDWVCKRCRGVNFARRMECFQCCTARPADADLIPLDAAELPTAALVVNGLELHTSEDALYKSIAPIARIKDLRMVRNRKTYESRGFAFVDFFRVEDATRVLERLHNTVIVGQTLPVRVSYARDGPGGVRPLPSSGPNEPAPGSLAAHAIRVARMAAQYGQGPGAGGGLEDSEMDVGISWTPAEFKEGDHEPEGDAHGYQYDQASGYYYDAQSGFYYDAATGLFYDGNNQQWYTYDPDTHQYNIYNPPEGQESEATGGLAKSSSGEGGVSAPSTVSAPQQEPSLPALGTGSEAAAITDAPNSVENAAVADAAPTPAKPAPPKIVKTSKITVKAKKVVKKLGTPAASLPAENATPAPVPATTAPDVKPVDGPGMSVPGVVFGGRIRGNALPQALSEMPPEQVGVIRGGKVRGGPALSDTLPEMPTESMGMISGGRVRGGPAAALVDRPGIAMDGMGDGREMPMPPPTSFGQMHPTGMPPPPPRFPASSAMDSPAPVPIPAAGGVIHGGRIRGGRVRTPQVQQDPLPLELDPNSDMDEEAVFRATMKRAALERYNRNM